LAEDKDKKEEVSQEEIENELDVSALEAEVEELKAKLQEKESDYVRVFADFENSKKRLEKEKLQAIDYSTEKFANSILPVIDSLNMALSSVETTEEITAESFENLKKGIELTVEQFQKALSKHYIEEIPTEEGFDPNFHNAIMQVDTEEAQSGEIVQVMQKGYKLKDIVLRPTMVSVAK
jgi:molecular chaperone GrpE